MLPGIVAIAHKDTGEVMIWGLEKDAKIQTVQMVAPNAPKADAIYSTLLSPDGERLVIARTDGRVETWNATTGEKLLTLSASTTLDGGASDSEIEFSPDGRLLVVTTCNGTQVVLDARTGEELRVSIEETARLGWQSVQMTNSSH